MKHSLEIRKTTWELRIKEFQGSITKARAWAKLSRETIDPITGTKIMKESKEIFVITGYMGRTSAEVREYLGAFRYVVFKIAFLDNDDREIVKEEHVYDNDFDYYDVHRNNLQGYSCRHSSGLRSITFV